MLHHKTLKTECVLGIGWVEVAQKKAQKYCEALNNMNAFPVPDRDTGSNILATLTALHKELKNELNPVTRINTPEDAVGLNLMVGRAWEQAIMRAFRSARGNSGALICTWALEAVRTYWSLPGRLGETMSDTELASLPTMQALAAAYAKTNNSSVPDMDGRSSAYNEVFALAAAAERVRQSIPEPALMGSTMGAMMLALADYRFHDCSGSTHKDQLSHAEYQRYVMIQALESTAQNPPAPELLGTVDAGALGFYLSVVYVNPRWCTARISDEQIDRMLVPPHVMTPPTRRRAGGTAETVTHSRADTPAWELMGTMQADAVAVAQIRSELEQLGNSLLITPLDAAAGLWNLHVHVASVTDARAAIARYGTLRDERTSSLEEHRESEKKNPL